MASSSFAILSYLRTGRLDNRGKAPIYLRITVNGHHSLK
ncbi:Arm DNA-binding domain-containing protein [Maribacter sp. 2307UL18-2]